MEYSIRRYETRDAAAVARALTSGAAIDRTLLPLDEDEWRAYVARPFNRGGRDFLVAARDDTIAAVAFSTLLERDGERLRSFRILVHPDHRRQGIATALFARIERQDDGDTTLRAETPARWTVGNRLLERAGFGVVERLYGMRAASIPEARALAGGVRLRPYRRGPDDDAAWRRLNHEAYAGTSDYLDLDDRERDLMRAEPGFHLWFALCDGRVVGLCHTKDFSGLPYINSLAVAASHRGRGLGRALLVAGMRTIRDRTSGAICLNVRAGNEPAVALYRSCGFTVDDDIREWWKRRP